MFLMVHLLWLSFISYRVSSSPGFSREFSRAVKLLPQVYSPETKQQFYKLIDNFGTHYITKVTHKKMTDQGALPSLGSNTDLKCV